MHYRRDLVEALHGPEPLNAVGSGFLEQLQAGVVEIQGGDGRSAYCFFQVICSESLPSPFHIEIFADNIRPVFRVRTVCH